MAPVICTRPTAPRFSLRAGIERCGNPNARVRADVPSTSGVLVVLCDVCAAYLKLRHRIERRRRRALQLAALTCFVVCFVVSCSSQIGGLADPAPTDDAPTEIAADVVDDGLAATDDAPTEIAADVVDDGLAPTDAPPPDFGACKSNGAVCAVREECCSMHCDWACLAGEGCRYACVPGS